MGSSTGAGGRGESTSPKRSRNPSPPRQGEFVRPFNRPSRRDRVVADTFFPDPQPESKVDADPKAEQPPTTNAEPTKPLAPPPRPAQQQPSGNSPDYFSNPINASLSLEPNPFEQSFGGAPETPGGTKLPSVASLTSPSSLLPGTGVTPFTWGGGSLRTGPLSPAMLSGPTNDYFSSDHIRGSFPTPNESSLRSGLTPGGSGSMFPAPSPNTQALFTLAGSTAATPGTLDFHRTALSAAAAKREQKSQSQAQQQPVTSQPHPQEMSNGVAPLKNETKPSTGPFDPHDNDAANGLFMLAQGRNGTQTQTQQYPVIPPPQQVHNHNAPAPVAQAVNTSPQMNGNASIGGSSARGVSEAGSAGSDESEIARPNTRAKGKRNSAGGTTNSRRKAEDSAGRGPASKKTKNNGGAPSSINGSFDDMDHSDDDDDMMRDNEGGGKSKMTDEEKRKNFLERNRLAFLLLALHLLSDVNLFQGGCAEMPPTKEAVAR